MSITYSFLTKEQSKIELLKLDDFLRSLNNKNIGYYVSSGKSNSSTNSYSLDDYLKLVSNACDEFHHKRKDKIINIIEKINPIWKANNLPDLNINFIQTTGEEAFDLPYTRGNSIILPSGLRNYSKKFSILDQVSGGLVIHEIFHILTRTYPELKKELYSMFGFFEVDQLKVEEFLINPDAPFYNQAITLEDEFKTEFTGVLNIHIKTKDGKESLEWKEIYNLKTKEYIHFKKTNLMERIGPNTEYIIHPEEICAEHFRMLFLSEDKDNKGFFTKYKDEIEDMEKINLFKYRLNNFKF